MTDETTRLHWIMEHHRQNPWVIKMVGVKGLLLHTIIANEQDYSKEGGPVMFYDDELREMCGADSLREFQKVMGDVLFLGIIEGHMDDGETGGSPGLYSVADLNPKGVA
jgi:hypothetical protein